MGDSGGIGEGNVFKTEPMERRTMLHGQRRVNACSKQAALLVLEVEDSSLLKLDLQGEAEACEAAPHSLASANSCDGDRHQSL